MLPSLPPVPQPTHESVLSISPPKLISTATFYSKLLLPQMPTQLQPSSWLLAGLLAAHVAPLAKSKFHIPARVDFSKISHMRPLTYLKASRLSSAIRRKYEISELAS